MRAGVVAIVLMAAAMLMPATAQGARHDMMPTWAWAWVDDAPFNDPASKVLLPANTVHIQGQVKDRGTPDDWSVKMTITVFGTAGQQLHRYEVADGDAVYRSLERRLELSAPVKSVRFDLCTVPAQHCVDFEVARPVSTSPTPTPTPGATATPTPQPGARVDRDQDGVPESADCDDTNSAVKPGAREYPGNGLDDDCAGGDQAAKMPGLVKSDWNAPRGKNPKVMLMQVRDALPSAQVTVVCEGRGCPFKQRRKTTDANGEVSLTKLFKRRLRDGIRLEVRIAAPGVITKVSRYSIRRGVVPRSQSFCIPLGALKPQRRC